MRLLMALWEHLDVTFSSLRPLGKSRISVKIQKSARVAIGDYRIAIGDYRIAFGDYRIALGDYRIAISITRLHLVNTDCIW